MSKAGMKTKEVANKPKNQGNNTTLPAGAHEKNMFQQCFIQTAVWYHATQADEWNINDKDLVPALQEIWDTVYYCHRRFAQRQCVRLFAGCTRLFLERLLPAQAFTMEYDRGSRLATSSARP